MLNPAIVIATKYYVASPTSKLGRTSAAMASQWSRQSSVWIRRRIAV